MHVLEVNLKTQVISTNHGISLSLYVASLKHRFLIVKTNRESLFSISVSKFCFLEIFNLFYTFINDLQGNCSGAATLFHPTCWVSRVLQESLNLTSW